MNFRVHIVKTVVKDINVIAADKDRAEEMVADLFSADLMDFDLKSCKCEVDISPVDEVMEDQECYQNIDWEDIQEGDYVYYAVNNRLYQVARYCSPNTETLFLINEASGDVKPMQEFYENEFYNMSFFRKIR